MPRSAVRSDLFITVGGDVTPLKAAMTAGKSVLNEFGSAAIDVQAEVTKAFAGMAANAPAEAKRLEQAYSQTFAQIRRNAQAVLSAPNGGTAANIINATGATQAAAAAEGEAAALRMVADAAARADAATKGSSAGTRAYAVAAEAAAQEAARYAAGLRSQAVVLGQVQSQLVGAGGSQAKFNQGNIAIVAGAGNARIAQMELMHVVRGSLDQFAAGASATQVLAMHMGMLGQAAALSGDSMGKFGRFMGGPYGLLLTAGISVLAMLVGKHMAAKKSAEEQGDAEKVLTGYVQGEKVATDALLESLEKLNEQESKSLETTNQAIRARYDLAKATLEHARSNRALLATQLETAKANLAEATQRQSKTTGRGLEAAAGQTAAAQSEVDRLQAAVAGMDKAIGQASAVIDTELVKLARNLATNVGRAEDRFDKLLTSLEARYRGTEVRRVDGNGHVTTTLVGGLLNQPGVDEKRRQQLLQQLTAEEGRLTIAREKAVAAARELDKAEQGKTETAAEAAAHFKTAVIGAEGTGPNLLGSSAAGFGQFMPKTWLTYFNRLFPDKAGLSDAAKLGFRNVREVASAVIDQATDDYVATLKGAGQQITRANLYAIHLLSSGDPKARVAMRLLNAPANEATNNFLSAKVLAGNPFLKGTAEHARSAIAGRIGDSSAAVSSGAAAIDQALKTQAERELQQQAAFDSDRDRLNGQLLDSLGQVAVGYEAEAASQLKQVQADHDAEATKIANALTEGKYGEATGELATTRAQQLQLANDELAKQRISNILVRRYVAQLDDIQKTADQEYGFRIDALRFLADNAKTASERRALELRIIDAQYDQLKADLEIARNKAAAAKDSAEVARIEARLANLPNEKAREQSNAIRGTQGPLDSYLSGLPRDARQVDELMQGIEVSGLEHAVDVLAEFRHGWKSARDAAIQALDDIAGQLLKLGLERLVGKLFKVSTETSAGQGAGLAAAGSTLSIAGASLTTAGGVLDSSAVLWQAVAAQLIAAAGALAAAGAINGATSFASLFGSAASASGAASSFITGWQGIGLAGLATGGWQQIRGIGGVDNNVLSINGRPLAMVSDGEGLAVIPHSMMSASPPSARRLAANSNQPVGGDHYHIHVQAPDTGDAVRDRQTGMQFAAGVEAGLSRRRAKGLR
jgi:hypothetical protein